MNYLEIYCPNSEVILLGEEVDEVAKMEGDNQRIKDEIEEMKRKYQLMMDYAKQNNMEIVS